MHVTSSPFVQQNFDTMPEDSSSHDIQQQLKSYKSIDPKYHLSSF
jgi:hypothetical protein